MIDRSEAAERFAQMVFDTGYKEGMAAPFDDMAHSFGDEKLQNAAEAFEHLDEKENTYFGFLLGKAVYAALFHVLMDLDGAAGYCEIEGRPAEFTLGLRIFEGVNASGVTGPIVQNVAIAPTERGDDLHDLFAGFINDAVC